MTDVNSGKNVIPSKEENVGSSISSAAVENAVNKVAEDLSKVAIHTAPAPEKALSPEEQYQKDKEAYVQARFNPTDPKEKAILELRLKVAKVTVKKSESEQDTKKSDESARELHQKGVAEKRDLLKKEFEAEFPEFDQISKNETAILEAFAKTNFKPSGKWKFESQSRYEDRIALERIQFIKDNRQGVLLDALRQKIRSEFDDNLEIEKLNYEENVQAAIDKPLNRTYEAHFALRTPLAVKKLPQEVMGHAATPVHFSLKAKALWSKKHDPENPKANPVNFYVGASETPFSNFKEREMMLTAHKDTVASSASLVRTEKALAEHTQKPFKRLGLKP
jgi:hypothetical protein